MSYLVTAVVRPDTDYGAAEQMYEFRVRAKDKPTARRTVLESAWAIGWLVSHFLCVQKEKV